MTFSTDIISQYANQFIRILVDYSPRLISAFLILFVGIYAIRLINRIIKNIMIKRELEPTLSKFLADILFWFLRIMLFVIFISELGVNLILCCHFRCRRVSRRIIFTGFTFQLCRRNADYNVQTF